MAMHLARQREILEILSRNGFAIFSAVAGLDRAWPSRRLVRTLTPQEFRVDDAFSSPTIVRRTLEELGPTFIKLGQILSTRADLVPPEFAAELAKLRTMVPPEPFASIKQTVEAELGVPLGEVFSSFEEEPLGSASIGQTHLARFVDGREVVVKVQRVGAEVALKTDIAIMRAFATALQRRWDVVRDLDLLGFVEEFDRQITGELDYTREGRNAERIAANFAKRPGMRVPKIHWEAVTPRVLTMERLSGIPIDDVAALDVAGIDRVALGKRAATFVLDMVLVDGFFHGDPHPGNLLVGPTGKISVLDFGMVGSLSDHHRRQLVAMVGAFAARDAARMGEAVVELAPPRGRIDRRSLNVALKRLIDQYAEQPLGEIPMVGVVNQLLEILRTQRLKPQPELSMVAKMLAMVDGLGRVLDPSFDMMAILRPYGFKLLLQQLEPDTLLRSLFSAAYEAAAFGTEVPGRVRRLLRHYEQEGVHVAVDQRSLDPALQRIDALGDRVVAGVLLAALISALGALGSTDQNWVSKARGPLLIAGSAAMVTLSGYLLESMRRRR